MGKTSSAVSRMNKLLLIVSALSALASAELCFNEYEVAGACTVGSDLAAKMMSALYQCDYPTYTKKSGDEDWHDALNRRGLNRQDNCHDVADIEQEFYTSMSEALGWGGEMGQCWSNMTSDIYDYFAGCDYSSEDWETLTGIVFVWSDMTCFGHIFDSSCSDYLRNEIYYYFGQKY